MKNSPWPRRPRALVAEDEESDRDVVVRSLEDEGFEVTAARSGREALDIIAERHFDVLVLDILLPYLDGFDVMKRLRTLAPDLLVRTVVVSRLATDELKLFFPVSRVFTKPVDARALRAVARELAAPQSEDH